MNETLILGVLNIFLKKLYKKITTIRITAYGCFINWKYIELITSYFETLILSKIAKSSILTKYVFFYHRRRVYVNIFGPAVFLIINNEMKNKITKINIIYNFIYKINWNGIRI